MIRTLGLTDLQVNGYVGVDFNDAALTADALDHALEMMRAGNVTWCLPTLISADEATLADRLAALDAAAAGSRLGKQMVPGFHLEGPFLNPAAGYAGVPSGGRYDRTGPGGVGQIGEGFEAADPAADPRAGTSGGNAADRLGPGAWHGRGDGSYRGQPRGDRGGG